MSAILIRSLEQRIANLESMVNLLVKNQTAAQDPFPKEPVNPMPVTLAPRPVDAVGYLRVEGLVIFNHGPDADTVVTLCQKHGIPAVQAAIAKLKRESGKAQVYVSELCIAMATQPDTMPTQPTKKRLPDVDRTVAALRSPSEADIRGVSGKRLAEFMAGPKTIDDLRTLMTQNPQFKSYIVWSDQ